MMMLARCFRPNEPVLFLQLDDFTIEMMSPKSSQPIILVILSVAVKMVVPTNKYKHFYYNPSTRIKQYHLYHITTLCDRVHILHLIILITESLIFIYIAISSYGKNNFKM